MNDEDKQRLDTLRAQLGHLNARARHYDDYAWKVPLSLFALAGFLAFRLVELKFGWVWFLVPAAPVVFGSIHLVVEWRGLHHTVDQIRRIEGDLGLPSAWFHESERKRRGLPYWH